MKTVEELARQVVEMLDAQARYFKSRSPEDLRASKYLESRLKADSHAILADAEGLFSTNPKE